jgi:hypothetical protein
MVTTSYPLLGGGVTAGIAAGLPLPSLDQEPASDTDEQPAGKLSPDFIKRLRDAIKVSYDDLRDHREQYVEREQLYAGHRYGTNNENVDTPFNCYNLALRVYQRKLISGDPKVNVRSRSPNARPEAYELALACEQLFREINLKDTMKEVILQALLSVGIVKVAGAPSDSQEGMGFLHDAEQPFCDPVLLENFVYDTSAKRWEQIDFCGDRYRLPLEVLKNDPRFNRTAVSQLGRGETRQDEDLQRNDQESVQQLGTDRTPFREEVREYVTLWDIWLPREKMMVTLPDGGGDPLLIQPWEGPENGPYHLLCFDPIPGNIMPVAPGGHLESMARLLNRAIRKLGDQLDRQKTIGTITPQAANAGDDKTIQNTRDGDLAQVQDPKNIGEIRIGGVDQQSYATTLGLRDLWSWLSGNIDVLGGLSTQADTLGQEQLLAGGGNSLISELNAKVLDFMKGVCTDLAWYVYSDPYGVRRLVKRVAGTTLELPVDWGPERRTRDFFLFEFEVDPFSVHVRTPSERLQMVLQMMPAVLQVAQLQMVLQQSGGELDMEGLWRLITRYSGLDEFSELLRFSGVPITAAPGQQQQQSGTSMPRMPSMSIPGMPREYIHKNVNASGSNAKGPGQQALAQMMSMGTTNANGGGGGMR